MIFTAQYETGGQTYTIKGEVYTDESVGYTSDVVTDTCSSLAAMKAALDKYTQELKKDFTSPTAWRLDYGWSEVPHMSRVEVTSITTNGREAWVRFPTTGERGKVGRDTLYGNEEACHAYIEGLKKAKEDYTQKKLELKAVVDRFLWAPKKVGDV